MRQFQSWNVLSGLRLGAVEDWRPLKEGAGSMSEDDGGRTVYLITAFQRHERHVADGLFRLDTCLYCSTEWYQLMVPWQPPLPFVESPG